MNDDQTDSQIGHFRLKKIQTIKNKCFRLHLLKSKGIFILRSSQNFKVLVFTYTVSLTTHPHLAPRLKRVQLYLNSVVFWDVTLRNIPEDDRTQVNRSESPYSRTAIPPLPLSAFVACYRANFTF